MVQTILNQIDNINSSLAWIKKNKPTDYDQKFLQLVEERRKLKKLKAAAQDNPAIAAYGVSQVGKSYLMNCIMQKNGQPFMLEADGTSYNFIEEMNPKTKNTEATGVVTRFSSFKRNPNRYCKDYPILMRCLSVADIIIILCEGYYNDIGDYSSPSEEEVEEKGELILAKYKESSRNAASPMTADDVLNIKAYFMKHLNNAQTFHHKSGFFDKLAFVVDRIPTTAWVDVFPILWNRSEFQTKLFLKMLQTLEKLQFAEYVYLPAQSLLHNGINEDTIMSVQCLNELFLSAPKYYTDAYLRNGDSYTKVEHLTKSEVCAVCAEIIVKIGQEYLNNTNEYCFDAITDPAVRSMLTKDKVEMTILNDNDMLDFPGARSRKKELLRTLAGDDILINVLLRGKVAYLFNMYNESMLINILLYCHHGEKNEVTDIPHLLNEWIRNYVGDTMEKRRRTLELTGDISPLFYIGTKFNMDMEYSTEEIANGINALNGRWHQRFFKTLYQECFNADGSLDKEDVKIFLNWTRAGECFKNSYLLRDYKYSGPLASKLYDGEKTSEKRMLIRKDYYEDLRNTFCSNEFVKKFFNYPQLSWDVAASIDNDGALYIIEQLSKVAKKMDRTREELFRNILIDSVRKMHEVMQDYFVSTDIDEILEGNIKKARAIFREMDFTCNTDNYYFGHLIQALQMSETDSYRVIHQVMQGAEINSKVNDFKDYEIIRNSCKNMGFAIDEAKSENDKWDCILKTYGFTSREEAEEFLSRKGITVSKLFSGSYKRKKNSYIIGDAIFDRWSATIKSVDFLNEFTGPIHDHEGAQGQRAGFDGIIMGYLVDNLIAAANVLNLRDIMADTIASYVNVIDIHTANESLLADMLASKINDFVMNFGFSYLTEEDIEKARKVCESRKIPAFRYILKEQPAVFEEEDLTAMFNDMSENPKALLPSFEDNYNKWIEFMFISFVAHLDVPDFDHEANVALSQILEKLKVE